MQDCCFHFSQIIIQCYEPGIDLTSFAVLKTSVNLFYVFTPASIIGFRHTVCMEPQILKFIDIIKVQMKWALFVLNESST